MNKQEYIDFLKVARDNQVEHSDMWYLVDEIIHEANKLETLSQEWIDENAIVIGGLHSNPQYIHVDKLENLHVSKQEKPVVSKHVAEWIEYNKRAGGTIHALTNLSGTHTKANFPKVGEDGNRELQELIARAWLEGYTIEEEPKYYVVNNKQQLILAKLDEGKAISYSQDFEPVTRLLSDLSHYQLTEQEIKDYDDRYWSFAVQVEEGAN